MISRRLLLSGFATLALTAQSHAGVFGFKTKAEREAEAAADAADLKALKRSLRLAKKRGKKLSADDLARLDALKRKEAERAGVARNAPVREEGPENPACEPQRAGENSGRGPPERDQEARAEDLSESQRLKLRTSQRRHPRKLSKKLARRPIQLTLSLSLRKSLTAASHPVRLSSILSKSFCI